VEVLSVTARQLLALFDLIYLTALAVWIGSAVFMVFGLNPIVLKAIGAESASKLIRAIYPRYYVGCAIAGAVALPAFVAGPLCYREYRGAMVAVQAVVIIFGILLMLYGANSLTPAIGKAPEGPVPDASQVEHWRRLATGLNLLLVVVALSLLVAHVIRPAPKTSGIIEMTPQERARYDAALNRVIEDVEVKYGLRPPRTLAPGESAAPGPLIDAETVREIESYYAKKRARDQARAAKAQKQKAGASP
jgi:Domain of unknown function (DUF4149)